MLIKNNFKKFISKYGYPVKHKFNRYYLVKKNYNWLFELRSGNRRECILSALEIDKFDRDTIKKLKEDISCLRVELKNINIYKIYIEGRIGLGLDKLIPDLEFIKKSDDKRFNLYICYL